MKVPSRTAVLVAAVAIVVAARAAALIYYAFLHPVTGITATQAASAPIRQPPPNQ